MAVSTQMQLISQPDGSLLALGLDYTAARAGLELAEIEITPEIWADLQIIEKGAIGAINEAKR